MRNSFQGTVIGRLFAIILLLGAAPILMALGHGATLGSLLDVGFESEQGYLPGDLSGQNGWRVDSGAAEVWTNTVYSGSNAARVGQGGSISHELGSGGSVVVFSAHLQAVPSPAPEIPILGQAAVLYLDADYGLTGLDGNGRGGGGWVGSGVVIPPGTWFELTLKLDFDRKRWEALVDGRPAFSSLGFHSDSVKAFRSLSVSSNDGETLVDQVRIDAVSASPTVEVDPISLVPFGVGFEPDEGFLVGDLDRQGGWLVDEGRAVVWTQEVASGVQAARIEAGGGISHAFAAGLPIVTFRASMQASATSVPEIPLLAQAAVLYLDPTTGLTGLDGDGQGGGRWVGSYRLIPAGTWVEVMIRLDFNSRTWDCLLNGQTALSGLHFHSDSVVSFGSVVATAGGGDTLMDGAYLSSAIPPPALDPSSIGVFPVGIGFETGEGYFVGDLDSQKGWSVENGQAEVWTQTVYSGAQAARVLPGGRISHEFATALPIVSYSTYLQATASPAPEIPFLAQAAVLYLDPSSGLTGLDGDGQGGGRWVGSYRMIPEGTWFELTLRLDFDSKTWDCLVNGQTALSGLRFHSDDLVSFGSVVATAGGGDTLLDAGRVESLNPPPPTPNPSPVSRYPFGMGFERQEGYFAGDLDSQNGWAVEGGQAEIWTQTVFSGEQAARITPGGRISHEFATGLPVVTVTTHLQASPSLAPEIPLLGQTAVLYLDPAYGLTGLDGDGAGGGHWVGSGVTIAPGTWFELSVTLDYGRKTWSCRVDGRLALSRMRFHSDRVAAFGTLTVAGNDSDTLLDGVLVGVKDAIPPPEWVSLPLGAGFEPEEGYSVGDLDGQNGWTARSSESLVWTNSVHSGLQAAVVGPGGRIARDVAIASTIVTFDAYVRASPSVAPEIPDEAQIAILYLDAVRGLTGLDGDGNGGGRWIGSGVTVADDAWSKVTIRVDFASKTWNGYLNGALVLTNLHFHANGILAVSALEAGAGATGVTVLDQVSFLGEDGPLILPSLTIERLGTSVQISWPADTVGYRLQVTASLGNPAWADVIASGNRFTEPIDLEAKYYRLVAP